MKTGIVLIFIILFFFQSSGNAQEQTNSGVVRIHFLICDFDPRSGVSDNTFRVWYLDSLTVMENVAEVFNWNIPIETRPPAKLVTSSFVYMDVRTGLCQNYLRFDKNEKPVFNFKANWGDNPGWNFYKTDSVSPLYAFPPFDLPDTLMEGIQYKRVAVENTDGQFTLRKVFYLTSMFNDRFIRIAPFIESKNPGYKVVQTDLFINGALESSVFIQQLSTRLSSEELEIFKQWGENARQTKLPVLTLRDSKQWMLENHCVGE